MVTMRELVPSLTGLGQESSNRDVLQPRLMNNLRFVAVLEDNLYPYGSANAVLTADVVGLEGIPEGYSIQHAGLGLLDVVVPPTTAEPYVFVGLSELSPYVLSVEDAVPRRPEAVSLAMENTWNARLAPSPGRAWLTQSFVVRVDSEQSVDVSARAMAQLAKYPSLRLLVEALARLVDRHVARWASTYAIDLFESYEDPDSWMIELIWRLPLPVERVLELSLQIGRELSKLLEDGEGAWSSPDWYRMTYLLETARNNGPS